MGRELGEFIIYTAASLSNIKSKIIVSTIVIYSITF